MFRKRILVLMLAFVTMLSLMSVSVFAEGGNKAGNCSHKNTYYDYNWDEGSVTFTSINNAYHRATGTGVRELWCEDCDTMLESEPYTIDDEELLHEYNENGVCTDCGHVNTCSHENLCDDYSWEDGDVTCTPFNSIVHRVTGTGVRETWCEDCETMIESESYTFNGDELYHNYDDDGICEDCGYKKALDERIYGSDRYDTSIAVANRYKAETGKKFENVVVAYGGNYPDALSGGYLAWVKDAPVILISSSVENKTADYISKNIEPGGTVYLLGGTGVVSSSFENRLKQKGIKTKRLGGTDRYETNIKILKEAEVDDEDILICSGGGYADSLSASATGSPILLVGNTLTNAQKTYIRSLNTEQFYLIGGTGAVSTKVESDIRNLGYNSADSIKRLAGATRFETSTAVAEEFFEEPDTVVFTYAMNFPDGLSGGPLATYSDAPIILTDSNNTKAAQNYVKNSGARWSITLGGSSLITDKAVKRIMGRSS